jgi:hypothetical protein
LITTEVDELTERVVTVKVAEVAVEGTVTLAGTVAAVELLLDKVTTAPAEGGKPLRVTVPVEFAEPPTTLVGFKVKELRAVAAGFTVSVAWAEPSRVAVMTEVAVEVTA